MNFCLLSCFIIFYFCGHLRRSAPVLRINLAMKTIQFREAIAEAMSEEMRKDESIYLMGEEVAEYNGAYKASKGMLEEFGPKGLSIPLSLNLVFPE